MSEPPPATIPRRHDLDALRAVAMLLGIVLHGAISFIPFSEYFWAVQDSQPRDVFGVLLAAIHGFRMPLFFLISGFFTAMLWRKRGLKALLRHRFKRIFLPMILSLLTIIPITWAVSDYVKRTPGTESADSARATAGLETASAVGDAESAARCIEQGADINRKNRDGATPLHIAVFFGRADVAEVLLEAGADVNVQNKDGLRPAELLNSSWEITKFIGDLVRIELNRDEVRNGRSKIADLLNEHFDAGIFGGEKSDPGSDEQGEKEPGNEFDDLLQAAMMFPLFGHLWFLWFLCWLVIGFAVCVGISGVSAVKQLPRSLTVSRWRLLWWLPLTVVPQSYMGLQAESFGPDTSIGLIPVPAVLFYYAVFFAFGVLYFDADDNEGRVGQFWWLALPLALFLVFPAGLGTISERSGSGRLISVVSQSLYAWLVSFGMMGLFRQFMSRRSQTMRYLSDSSYWLYLAHIPLIIYAQYVVRDWTMFPLTKFLIVCSVTSAILLVTYQLFVRYTLLGTLLNGPRKRPETTLNA